MTGTRISSFHQGADLVSTMIEYFSLAYHVSAEKTRTAEAAAHTLQEKTRTAEAAAGTLKETTRSAQHALDY